MPARAHSHIHGLVLAGGLGRRMGGDKAEVLLRGQTLLSRTCERLAPQCATLAVSRYGSATSDATFADYPIVSDDLQGRAGPLAGVLAALDWIAEREPAATHLVTVGVDMPFLPMDLVSRLVEATCEHGSRLACAASGTRNHPIAALWPVGIRSALRDTVVGEDTRRVVAVLERYGFATASWPTTPHDPFFNVNTPEDLAAADVIAQAIEIGLGSSPQ